MTASTPHPAENSQVDDKPGAATVRVLLTAVEGADLEAALAVLKRQVYEPTPEIAIVGGEGLDGLVGYPSLEAAIAATDSTVDYLWFLHSDARPRPDALAALVREVERNEASLGGSKLLVAGSRDELEEVGSATDVFGEPYSGLEEGEIDLQQYDVVREVAFVRSASMLARRDLAQGLRGLDELLPPVAAGLDFSQRTRLAGGRVISVPSSEVYHQGRCNPRRRGWREQAGRMRAMFTAYRPLTLLWVVPYDILVSIVDSIANLLLLRWRPLFRHLMSWLWNLLHLPTTIQKRIRLKKVRVTGDEELFRFQARGSVRLREVGTELSSRVLSVFDDDETLATRTRRFFGSPGIWGAIVASVIALVAARSFVFVGMPDIGSSFPFEPASTSMSRWFGGWNSSGLGSAAAGHPSVLVTAALTLLTLGSGGAARTLFTILLAIIGIGGMGRLGGRLGLRGPGRYLAGLVLIAGPGTAVLTGSGSWVALAAAAFLPWMVRAVLVLPVAGGGWTQPMGWAVVLGGVLAAFSPLLVFVPVLVALMMSGAGVWRRRVLLGLVGLVSLSVAVPFLLGDPGWALDTGRRLALLPERVWPVLIGGAVLPLLFFENPWRRVGVVGALLALGALLVLRLPIGGPGAEEALLIVVSFGAALVVAAGMDLLSREPMRVVSLLAAGALLVLSIGPLGNGRYGLPAGDINDDLGFASVLTGETGPGRILMASANRSDIPGEARAGPGFWYRVVDATGVTHNQTWLPAPRPGDDELRSIIDRISRGDELHPGALLAPFAVDWVVLQGPEFRLDEVLRAQVDMVRRVFDPDLRVFENLEPQPLAGAPGVIWERAGAGFSGRATPDSIRLAVNNDYRWSPSAEGDGWAVRVSGVEGTASFGKGWRGRLVSMSGGLVVLAGLVLIAFGRVRQ